MHTPWRLALLSTVLLAACSHAVEPCPSGMMSDRAHDRCISVDENPVNTPDAALDGAIAQTGPDASTGLVLHGDDAGTSLDAAPDPGVDASTDAASGATGTSDAAVLTGDAGVDAALPMSGADGGAPLACSSDDVNAWHDFHLSGRVVSSIDACFKSSVGCSTDACMLDRCLAKEAGVSACDTCVADEVSCVAKACLKACDASSTDAACRACACANGCIAAFESCAGTPLDVCGDCDAMTCAEASLLPPELIMALLQPVLMPPVVTP